MNKELKINFVPMDPFACGMYRVKNIADLLYKDYKITISPPGSFHNYGQDIIFTQRVAGTKNIETLLAVKKASKAKFIADYDDDVWNELPKYNLTAVNWRDNKASMKDKLNELLDLATVSTETLKESLSEFIPASKIIVIPNMLPRFKWNYPRINPPTTNSILYAGSPTHFSNQLKIYGDFTEEWDKFLHNKEVNIMGICPWFIKPTKVYDWVDMNCYAHNFYGIASQNRFIIAPLADNYFNKCKSDLKYLESCAVGRVALVTDFDNSPYHFAHELQKIPVRATAKQIEYAMNQCNEHYQEIIEYQYEYLNKRWLENNLEQYIKLFEQPIVKI